MNRTNALAKNRFIVAFLLLLALGQQINGQKKEPRKYFPINDHTAFIDVSGTIAHLSSDCLQRFSQQVTVAHQPG